MLKATIDFSKFIEVSVEKRLIFDEMEDCLVLPLRPNGIRWAKGGKLLMELLMPPRKPNPNRYLYGLMLHYCPPLVGMYFKIKKLGYWEQVKHLGVVTMEGGSPTARISKGYKEREQENHGYKI